MRSKEEFAKLMTTISEKTGDNAEVMELLKSAQTDYNESMDAKPASDADNNDLQGRYNELNDRYNNLVNEYRNRFFGIPTDNPAKPDLPDVPGVPAETPKDDPSTVSFDDLFEETK